MSSTAISLGDTPEIRAGLPDGKRTNFIELLPRLDAKTCNGQIVDLF